VPPSRRHSRTTTPPTRRPRVAGLRRPGSTGAKPVEPDDLEPVDVEAPGRHTLDEPAPEPEPPIADDEPAADSPVLAERDPVTDTLVTTPVIGGPDPEAPAADTEIIGDTEDIEDTVRPARSRPAGKRRSTGVTVSDDLAEAEAEVAAQPERATRPRRDTTLTWAIALAVVALLIAGLAVWFRGEANSRTEGADTNNRALTDPATQSEVVRQVRAAIEKTLSYNYTDLDSTAKAVRDNVTGKALCEYDQLFGEVKKLAPEQKIVLSTQVREIGVTRLEGDQAVLLVFVDQRTTRADQNQTTASGAQFAVKAQHQGSQWKITEFDMLGQPLPNGKPAPQC
jgi:Mce-associated membrane protein